MISKKKVTNNHWPWYGLSVEQHEPSHRESDLKAKLNLRARWRRSKNLSAKWVYLTVTAGESNFQTLFLSPRALQGQQSRWLAPVRRGTREWWRVGQVGLPNIQMINWTATNKGFKRSWLAIYKKVEKSRFDWNNTQDRLFLIYLKIGEPSSGIWSPLPARLASSPLLPPSISWMLKSQSKALFLLLDQTICWQHLPEVE